MGVKLDVMQFLKYEHVRRSGVYNMITEAGDVMQLIQVSPEQYAYILQHYHELLKESEDFLDQHDGALERVKEELSDRAEEICSMTCRLIQDSLESS